MFIKIPLEKVKVKSKKEHPLLAKDCFNMRVSWVVMVFQNLEVGQ